LKGVIVMIDIKLNRREFLKMIQIVDNAIVDDKSNSSKTGTYVEVLDDKIVLKGMSDGLFIKAELPCEVIEKGEFIIRHKLMEEFLKQLDSEIIQIKEVNNKINIISGKSSSEFSIYQYEKMYEPKVGEVAMNIEFDRNELLNDINNVKFAADLQLGNKTNCIRFEKERTIKFISSDQHRLVYLERGIAEDDGESLSISIPLRSINSLSKIMNQLDDEVINFRSDGARVLFKFKDVEVISKLNESPYPMYKPIIESISVCDKKATINIKDLTSMLKRIYVFVKDNKDKKDVALLVFKSNSLEILGRSDLAESSENLPIIYEGEELKIALNIRFILDYLQTIQDSEFIEVSLYSDVKPIFIKDNLKNSLYLVAPTKM
jgi:DNA polymerase III beta subunit, C-terminal domain